MPTIKNSDRTSVFIHGVEIKPGETKYIHIENAPEPRWLKDYRAHRQSKLIDGVISDCEHALRKLGKR